jgi:hypothetical protein
MTVSRYLFVGRAVVSRGTATRPFAEAGETEPRPRTRNVIAELLHADAIAAHHEMHDRIGEKIDQGRLLARFEPLPRDMREIRAPLLTHNCTPKQ